MVNLLADAGHKPDALLLTRERFASDNAHGMGTITLDGSENASVKYAMCCRPIPGDNIVGYLGRGEGLAVHAADCPVAKKLQHKDGERFMGVEWSDEIVRAFETDLALTVIVGDTPELVMVEHLGPLDLGYDPEVAAAVRLASNSLDAVRANAAWLLHADQRPIDEVVAYVERWGLLPLDRARKAVEFLTSPTWRAYISCYVEGFPLCRDFVAGDPARFATLITEQVVPADLVAL